MPLLLDEHIGPEEISALRDKVARLEDELEQARMQLNHSRAQFKAVSHAQVTLRRQLEPLHKALKALFGELDAAGIEGMQEEAGAPQSNAKWESWKQRMPGKAEEFIDLLLTHDEMSAAQLKAAAHCSSDTVYHTVHKLNKAGLLNKNGGKFSLKQL